MSANQVFHTRTALAVGLRELFRQLAERLALSSPVNVFLAGGMAVHLYTGSRDTTDVDAEIRKFAPEGVNVWWETLREPDFLRTVPLLSLRGRMVIEPQYSFARPFHQGLAYVGQGRASAYIRSDGQAVWRRDE